MPNWLLSAAPRAAACDLYCFPHGGGTAAEYLRWARDLRSARVHAVQLPGRMPRLDETVPGSMRELVEAFVAQAPLATGPFVFFGHSLGALFAYEVTRALATAGRPLPGRLVVSGFRAPHLPHPATLVHRLPDDELLDTVSRLHGGLPEEVLASAELRKMAAGALRADYRILETYVWHPGDPLPVPLTVFGGEDDRITADELEAWGEHTAAGTSVRRFPGGHFYLRERPAPVQRALAAALATVRSAERGTPC
ncbi:thioesterase II family protein [Streptomyces sp. NPDC020490]|uniref:thioesterase II family protein n=1 Tax=Streptomyces sp. NPDC020490 TaxID=3365078 RepID=UPI0037ADE5E0